MLKENIKLLEQLINNYEYCRCSVDNSCFDIGYEHITAIEELLKNLNKNIVCIKFREIEYWDNNSGDFERYVLRDENFEKNFEQLSKLMLEYENFQEIEDFISENFEEIKIEEYEINY